MNAAKKKALRILRSKNGGEVARKVLEALLADDLDQSYNGDCGCCPPKVAELEFSKTMAAEQILVQDEED